MGILDLLRVVLFLQQVLKMQLADGPHLDLQLKRHLINHCLAIEVYLQQTGQQIGIVLELY